jgi:hypothetical protein
MSFGVGQYLAIASEAQCVIKQLSEASQADMANPKTRDLTI